MANVPPPAALKVSKKTLSMFLRTRCDRELFFSLHKGEQMAGLGLPEPIKRPGIGTLAIEGREFEVDRNDRLVKLFSNIIRFSKSGDRYLDVDLEGVLSSITINPFLILQGRFSVRSIQADALGQIGLDPVDVAVVPPLADFVPDVIYVRRAQSNDMEVRPDGSRAPVDSVVERRMALHVIDIKHTAESNPSYCSEIAMYAIMLSNWLDQRPMLKSKYFVTSYAHLWTRAKQGSSQMEKLESQGGSTDQDLLAALVADSEDAQLRFYLTSIRRFFEDVVRVVRRANARPGGWQDLDWHVTGSCGGCDWLGDKRHMGQQDGVKVDSHPNNYCMPLARATGHLCLVPGITRGAKKVLCQSRVNDALGLAGAVGHPVLQQHTLLKRESKTLPARSTAITTGNLTIDASGAIASLVPSAHLLLYASVNFDSSSGLLTGLSLCGIATSFTPGRAPRRFRPVPYIVDQKSLIDEWVALEGFLTQIAGYIDNAESMVGNGNSLTGQIHFWEQRQFHELCNAMGRHLPRIMALSERKAKALAWVFPTEEMIGRPEALDAATVVAVDEIVRRLVFAPSEHVITLFDTSERYCHGSSYSVRDSYYREYLSNGIPRERIYEIWSNSSQIKRGTSSFPRNTVIAQYSDALSKQSRALEAICEKLRQDFSGKFRAKSARIPTSIPQGAAGVAFDSKLWLWWDKLDFNVSQLEAHIKLSMDGERLEASYEAIVLQNGSHVAGNEYEFDVAAGSTEAKFKGDSILTLGKIGLPGMPLQRAAGLLRSNSPRYQGDPNVLLRPLWSVLEANLVHFDRQLARARVALRVKDEPQLIPYLIANASFSLLHDVFLVEAKKPKLFNWAEHSAPIFEAIGSPSIAMPDQNAARAMGIAPPVRRRLADSETPAARVLWNPAVLENNVVLPPGVAQNLAAHVRGCHTLNNSQESAVTRSLERSLTLIWGPPGTGKTNTLAAMLHAMVFHSVSQQQPLRILITGPTYKAVEEVIHRFSKFIGGDVSSPCKIYFGHSQNRVFAPPPAGLPNHVDFRDMYFVRGSGEFENCLSDIVNDPGVVVVGCPVRQARQFPKRLGAGALHGVFDVVVIDESSQVPVSHAVAAFSGMKNDSRLIIAGDHLQMPPIASVEAPKDARYLVGSIQTYLTKRPFSVPLNPCLLERNYRSAGDLVEFARYIGYPSNLSAEYPSAELHMMRALEVRANYPVSLPWCDAFDLLLSPSTNVATLLHEDDISSQGNRFEAQVVAGMVWMLRQVVSAELDGRIAQVLHRDPTPEEFWKNCVGIVTPHRAQRALVMRELENLWPSESDLISEAVDTVERFQGGERHTIIVTFGVADVDVIGGEEAFLMQLERTNVAVSRAMAKCIVVMPNALAAHIPEDKRALETAYALKDYVEEFCNCRVVANLILAGVSRPAQVRYR